MGRVFKIEVSSDFEDLWRYNIALACEMLDEEGKRLDFASAQQNVAEVGAQLKAAPKGWSPGQELSLVSIASDSVRIVLYFVAHTLPQERKVNALSPFEVRLVVKADDEIIYNKIHYVDQRGGAAINLLLP